MPEETISLAVLFADISQSTKIYETLGDEAGQKLVSGCLELLAEVAGRYQGTLVKTIGDEAMCTFPDAELATSAAKAMQEALEGTPVVVQPGIGTPSIRVGYHLGQVIRSDEDVFGDAVNVAARMVALAKARQILTTEETVEALASESRAMIRQIDTAMVKGKKEELDIYEVIWEQQEVTIMLQDPLISATADARIKLISADTTVELNRARPIATMGRHRNNDVVVDDVLASRTHARIEYRRSRFVLIDQSTNGTYLFAEGQEGVCLHRDEIPLQGSGKICLGRPLDEESPLNIEYSCEP